MSHSRERQFDNLARIVREWADRDQAESPPPDWRDIQSSMGRSRSGLAASGADRRRILGAMAVAAFAVIALMLVRGMGHTDREISFVVSEGAASRGGASRDGNVVPSQLPARLAFSDGSDVVLQPGGRGVVVGTTARGARVRLEEGRARFAIVHRTRTEWTVEAGPYVVLVHGTVFDVSWAAQDGRLSVDLMVGAVTVRGPVSGGSVVLRPGQRLTARASTGEGHVDSIPSAGESGAPVPTSLQPAPERVTTDRATAVAPEALRASSPDSAPRRHEEPTSHHRAGSNGPPAAPPTANDVADVARAWPSRVASGLFQSVIADVDAAGVERCLAEVPIGSLSALADAARYVRRTELARRTLLAERRRFPGSADAHDAAFLIGRLSEDAAGDAREALIWYDRYLQEGDHGTYAAEALGRKMLALARLGEDADARIVAERYLDAYPNGAFAKRARKIRQSP